MKYLVFTFLISTSAYSNNLAGLKDVITDPAVSRRCKALIKTREEKIRYQQKLNFLIVRNKKLRERTNVSQVSLRNRLELNQIQLKNNIRLTEMRLKSMDENIVRKGCPGISL